MNYDERKVRFLMKVKGTAEYADLARDYEII